MDKTPQTAKLGRNSLPSTSIMEFLTRKDGTVYGAELKFWKEDRAAGTAGSLAPGSSDLTRDVLNPVTQHTEVLDEVSST